LEIKIDFIFYLFLSFLLSLSCSLSEIKSPPDNHRNQVATATSFANKKPPNSGAKRVSEIRVRLPKTQLPRTRPTLRKGRLQTAAAADALLPTRKYPFVFIICVAIKVPLLRLFANSFSPHA
jgi:hypothetical protein